MRKRIIIASSVLLLSTALLIGIGTSYSWFVDIAESKPVTVSVANINTSLFFNISDDRGIPGETILLAGANGYENRIMKGTGSADYIFKLTYTLAYEEDQAGGQAVDLITGLRLDPEVIKELGIIEAKDFEIVDRNVIYYGKHTGDIDIELGGLLVSFDKLKNSEADKGFEIKAEIEACQVTEMAVSDMFGIDSTIEYGKYAGLFQ